MHKQKIKNFRLDYSEYTGIECTVPCSMYSVLLEHSLIKDPYYGENEKVLRNLSLAGCVFYTTFTVSHEEFIESNILLRFHGLDTLCRIVLNDEELARTDNMHLAYTFDVKGKVVYGENTLRLEFDSPIADGQNAKTKTPDQADGSSRVGKASIRKPEFMYGCNWSPSLPDMGIFRDIELISFSHKIIDDFIVRQIHNEDGTVRINLEMTTLGIDSMSRAIATLVSPGGESYYCGLIGGKGSILLKNPNLWWPNGLGVQNLYRLSVNLYSDNELEDSRDIRIGLRTLTSSYEHRAEEGGEEFALNVNGVTFFTKGACYVPEDVILPRLNKDRTRQILKGCKEANFNSVRVCGGAFYPHDYFYELCDELGLVVWQEIVPPCYQIPMTEKYGNNLAQEIRDNLRRLAYHPSLGVVCSDCETERLCPNNEASNNEGADSEYLKLYEDVFPSICAEIIPDTLYLPPAIPSDGRFTPINKGENDRLGYRSNLEIESLPCAKTARTFASRDDLNLFSPVMESHQRTPGGNEKMILNASKQYRYPNSFDTLIYATQLFQGEAIRGSVENMRRHRGVYMGCFVGRLNDCWQTPSQSSIDYCGRWKALHYYAKRFYSPVLVSASNDGTRVTFNISSEQRNVYEGRFSYSLLDNKNNTIFSDSFDISVAEMSTLDLPAVDFADKVNGHEREYYIAYSIVGNTASSFGTMLFVPPKSFDFLPPKIDAVIDGNLRDYTITLTTDVYARGVELDFAEVDAIFEDNYFDLTSCSAHRIHFTTRDVTTPETLRRELRVKTVYDIGR